MGIYGVLLYDPIVLSYADAESLALSIVRRGIIRQIGIVSAISRCAICEGGYGGVARAKRQRNPHRDVSGDSEFWRD